MPAQVVFYGPNGRQLQAFDFGSDEGVREFTSCAFNPSGDAVVFGTFNRFYVFAFNAGRSVWEQVRRVCATCMRTLLSLPLVCSHLRRKLARTHRLLLSFLLPPARHDAAWGSSTQPATTTSTSPAGVLEARGELLFGHGAGVEAGRLQAVRGQHDGRRGCVRRVPEGARGGGRPVFE